MAPELLRYESSNTAMTDVYSFGVILYEVYSRREPYEGEKGDINDILGAIVDKESCMNYTNTKEMSLPQDSLVILDELA